MKKIVVIGSSNADIVLDVREMPKKGETVNGLSMKKMPGGKGANQACACGKLHGQCTFISAVGYDDSGEMLLNSLKDANVNTDYMLHCLDAPSGTAIITVDASGENSIIIISGANSACNMDYFKKNREVLSEADYVLTQLETPCNAIYDLLLLLKQQGKTVILNPAPAPDFIPDNVLQIIDYLTPNETELAKLTQHSCQTEEQIYEAAEICLQKGVKNILITLGDKGALFVNADTKMLIPAFKMKAVDTTAAGDTFNAAFVVALAEDLDVKDAIRFANAAAAISVSRKGAQPSIPTREEVEFFMKKTEVM